MENLKKKPDDYVISTGKQFSVKQFQTNCKKIRNKFILEKKGKFSLAKNKNNNQIIVKQNKKYFRAAEVEDLLGDSSKAKNID